MNYLKSLDESSALTHASQIIRARTYDDLMNNLALYLTAAA